MTAARAIAPGTLVGGKYRVERSIGGGGMGWVYAADEPRLQRRVALKILDIEDKLDADQSARLFREARVAVHIESEHVAKGYDFGVCEELGLPYIAFELLHGDDLERVLEEEAPLPVVRAVDYVLQALAGIAAAHVEGIVHRDLKPANLFRVEVPGKPPVIKVLDFGIAKAVKGREIGRALSTATDEVFGTPLYMAPEQLRSSKRVDHRADIWSVGVILYELVTGTPPFVDATLGVVLTAVMEGEIVPPERQRADIPPALGAAILRCMDRRREGRFQSVRELARALAPFGTPASTSDLLAEIDDLFSQSTDSRSFDAELADTAASDRTPIVGTVRADGGAARPSVEPAVRLRPKSSSTFGLAALGGLVLLILTMALGFFLARK